MEIAEFIDSIRCSTSRDGDCLSGVLFGRDQPQAANPSSRTEANIYSETYNPFMCIVHSSYEEKRSRQKKENNVCPCFHAIIVCYASKENSRASLRTAQPPKGSKLKPTRKSALQPSLHLSFRIHAKVHRSLHSSHHIQRNIPSSSQTKFDSCKG
jgi:hypothetical protein